MAVFIPVLFMGGIVGRLMHEFAVTISVAILVSGFVSLSLTPMLCSRFLRFTAPSKTRALYRISERGFEGIARFYDRTLAATMRHGIATMGVSFLLLFGTFYLFTTMPKGFIPSQDSGFLFGLTQAAQGSSFDYMVSHQDQVIKIVRADPNTESVFSFVGAGFVGAMNTGIFFVKTKPRDQRPDSVDVDDRRAAAQADVPGAGDDRFHAESPAHQCERPDHQESLRIDVGGPDIRDLYKWAPILTAKVSALPGFADVSATCRSPAHKLPWISIATKRRRWE